MPIKSGYLVRRWFGGISFVVGAVGGVYACTSSTAPMPLAACTGPVTLQVSASTTPTISWTPACLANDLTVVTDSAPRWAVGFIADTNMLAPPITWGVVPAGAGSDPVGTPLSLIHDTTYVVRLFVGNDTALGGHVLIGIDSIVR